MPENDRENTHFMQVLADMRNGLVLQECSERLQEIIDAVVETGKPGKLSLVLTIEPSGFDHHGRCNEMTLTHGFKLTRPAPTPGKTTFFTTDENGLTRHDPDQLQFELKRSEQEERTN